MSELIERAQTAKRESKRIEFKSAFDPTSSVQWLRLIKDIVAMANSGGGVLVFGLDSCGEPVAGSCEAVLAIDPADISNKISKFTRTSDFEIEIVSVEKVGINFPAFLIGPAPLPLVFEKNGNYEVSGKQYSAFAVGTVYFRHGAKSEPGTGEDLRAAFDRQVHRLGKSWLKGMRKVVEAPLGSKIIAVKPVAESSPAVLADRVRAVNDQDAIPVHLTHESKGTAGLLIHEQISDSIFDEVNNVVDADRVLGKGVAGFSLGEPHYWRMYGERFNIKQDQQTFYLLFKTGARFYVPSLYWSLLLPEEQVARVLAEFYIHPISPSINFFTRTAFLLGREFCEWLKARWQEQFGDYAIPPDFYKIFLKRLTEAKGDPRLLAARISISHTLAVAEKPGKRVIFSSSQVKQRQFYPKYA